jgi:endo-1,4-beta-xylanase
MKFTAGLAFLLFSSFFKPILNGCGINLSPKKGSIISKSVVDNNSKDLNQLEDSIKNKPLKYYLPFPLGAAIKFGLLKNNAVYRNLVAKEFNSLTAENAMKFSKLHPAPDVFKWDDAEYIVNFAVENHIRMHGHTLIWARTRANPNWIVNFKGDKNAWDNLLKVHITTIVNHFKGRVASWDVVNEAFAQDGSYSKSIWLDNLGPDYIAKAFQYAHAADPKLLLFYNDYGQEYGGQKMQAILKMVKNFKKRGIPIDGIGMQFHTSAKLPDYLIKKGILSVASTGLLVHISELDISVRFQSDKSFALTQPLEKMQADKFRKVFLTYLSIPKKQQYGITTWNVGDKDSFRNSKYKNHDHPLLFDENYQPKLAYKEILQAFRK